MVSYNPKDWFTLVIQFHKSDTFRRLIPAMLGIGAFTAIVVSLEIYVLHWAFKNITIVHSILGFILSMLLVFRTNGAYDRWWEGRKAWGDIVNQSRNLTLKLNAFVADKNAVQTITNLISNYNFALKNHLRNNLTDKDYHDLSKSFMAKLQSSAHQPNIIAKELIQSIVNLYSQKLITDTQFLMLNEEMRSFTNNCGVCERIKNTPIPYSYNLFLKKVIFLYVFTIPFAFGPEFQYVTILIAMTVLYVFASIELIAEEIEDPFGEDDNDLPTDDLCVKIKANILEINKE